MVDWSLLYSPFAARLTELVAALKTAHLSLVGTSGYRSPAEQATLYAQGRTRPGKVVTNARACQSPHNWGCAVDFAFRRGASITWDGDWHAFGAVVRGVPDLRWGGDFSGFLDRPHVELAAWRAVRAAKWRPRMDG